MKLNKRHIELLEEAGIIVPDGVNDSDFMTAEDIEKLEDSLMNSLDSDQEETEKSMEIGRLLTDLAKDGKQRYLDES